MKKSPFCVVLLLVLAACLLGDKASAASPGEVLALDADNFAGALKKHAFIAVEFYAPVSEELAFTYWLGSAHFSSARLLTFIGKMSKL